MAQDGGKVDMDGDKDILVASDAGSECESYAPHDAVLQKFLDMKMLLHTKLAMPNDIEMPPYRLLGRFCMNSPELWGHSLAALADEWCCAYLNTSGGMLFVGVDSDGTIEGLPLNSHHMHIHAFLAPFFSALDQFWPAVSHGLITVALLPVYTQVTAFDPYYVMVIRVKRGPFPLYTNSKLEAYVGDFVLKKLAEEEAQAQLQTLDAAAMMRYLQVYRVAKNRGHPTFGDVLKGERPFVFHYSSHWSHPPLTLIPESAAVGTIAKGGAIVGAVDIPVHQHRHGEHHRHEHGHRHEHREHGHHHHHQDREAGRDVFEGDKRDERRPAGRRTPPCVHNKWKFVNSEPNPSGSSIFPYRINLICDVCGAFWSSFSKKQTMEEVRCKYYARGRGCREGDYCKFNHIIGTVDDPSLGVPTPKGTPKGGYQSTPKSAPRTPKQRKGQNPLSGLMRKPEPQLPELDAPQVVPQVVPSPAVLVHSPVKKVESEVNEEERSAQRSGTSPLDAAQSPIALPETHSEGAGRSPVDAARPTMQEIAVKVIPQVVVSPATGASGAVVRERDLVAEEDTEGIKQDSLMDVDLDDDDDGDAARQSSPTGKGSKPLQAPTKKKRPRAVKAKVTKALKREGGTPKKP